jgi:hypothetical protein
VRTRRRPRHNVSPLRMTLLRPLFRYSVTRDAYVLRVVGRRLGPVLTPAPPPPRANLKTLH